MMNFDFENLIMQYMTDFTIVTYSRVEPAPPSTPTETGYYNDSGDWVQGETGQYDNKGEWENGEESRKTMQGAIIGYDENTVLKAEGKISSKDKTLFMLEPLEKALMGSFVVYKGEKYSIDSQADDSEFTGVYVYSLRYVSAFIDKGVKDG